MKRNTVEAIQGVLIALAVFFVIIGCGLLDYYYNEAVFGDGRCMVLKCVKVVK
jgi:hypothetical protein